MTKTKKAIRIRRPGSKILGNRIEDGSHTGAPVVCLHCRAIIREGDPCCTVCYKNGKIKYVFCSRDHQQEKEHAELETRGFYKDLPLMT